MHRQFLKIAILCFSNIMLFLVTQGNAQIRYKDQIFPDVIAQMKVQFGANLTIYNSTLKLYMDIYQPLGDSLNNRPAIIWIHGGGLTSGNRSEMSKFCTYFAKLGYVTATIDYRTGIYPPAGATQFAEALLRGVQDGKAAVRFFRANSAVYKVDSTRIFVGGSSAGSFLSAHMGYWDQNEIPTAVNQVKWGDIEGTSGNPGYSSEIQGLLCYCGAINDTTYIQAGEPPVGVFHGAKDMTVPVDAGIFIETGLPMYGGAAIARVATRMGIFNRAAIIPEMGHGVGDNAALADSLYRFTAQFFYALLQQNTGVKDEHRLIVRSAKLEQNYPNPFNPTTRIRYRVNRSTRITLTVYDALGREINRIVDSEKPVGDYEVEFNGMNLSSGVYFCRLQCDNFIQTRKLLLLR